MRKKMKLVERHSLEGSSVPSEIKNSTANNSLAVMHVSNLHDVLKNILGRNHKQQHLQLACSVKTFKLI